MQFSTVPRLGLVAAAAGALLAGCGQQSLTGAAAPGGLTAGPAMRARAKSQKLLYIAEYSRADVLVYTYPGLDNAAVLTGFNTPSGECVDAAGDVWITDSGNKDIVEYAHGGTSPIATLADPGGSPDGCAVDPLTGDLAVANPINGSQGNVEVYPGASGTPAQYAADGMKYYYYCTYDAAGNLFVDGDAPKGAKLAELPAGGNALTLIKIEHKVPYPSGVQWHGSSLAFEDGHAPAAFIDRFKIGGGKARLAGKTALDGATNLYQFEIQGKTVVVADKGANSVFFYQYPQGGSPFVTISGLGQPEGIAISAP